MFRSKQPASSTSISIARGALESIFDECDQYDSHETGGRLIGTYLKKGSHYDIQLLGVIGPGPQAKRSAVSFLQDGEYQETIFRRIEEKHPEIEHLGNWHTHHCNGLATLSHGDHTTYHNIVNHGKHNTDFFYALLVVRKNHGRDPRYLVKHFIFHRNSDKVDEIAAAQVRIIDTPALWSHGSEQHKAPAGSVQHSGEKSLPNVERAKDQDFFTDFHPKLKALYSKSVGAPYWKGAISLIDGSDVEVVALEDSRDGSSFYSIGAGRQEPALAEVLAAYKERRFRSARHAVLELQTDLNRAIYGHKKG
jgi:hypothetical protein